MSRIMKLAAAFTAASVLGAGAASAEVVTYYYQQSYDTPLPGEVYVSSPPVYAAPAPRIVTRVEPRTIIEPPATTVAEPRTTVVTRSYIEPRTYARVVEPGERYVTQSVETRVVVRPVNCGVYHYWNGAACVDARDYPPVLTTD